MLVDAGYRGVAAEYPLVLPTPISHILSVRPMCVEKEGRTLSVTPQGQLDIQCIPKLHELLQELLH